MIYLDNAATSFPKPLSVIREVNRCLREYCGNPGRGAHSLSLAAAERVYLTRELIAEFLNIDTPERVVFTQNATHALNFAIKTSVRERCHIITSDIEHNSVLRPLYALSKSLGCEISHFDSSLPPELAIEPLIRSDTRFIITTLSSNVTGKRVDICGLSRIAKTHGIELIVDASQYIGHGSIDLTKTPVSILCAPGHKALYGIQGSGFAVVLDERQRDTYIEGGSGSDSFNKDMPKNLPERFEAGTLSTPAIVSLGEGIRFINKIGLPEINEKLSGLTDLMRDYFDIKNVRVLGCENGICAFNLVGYSSEQVAKELDGRGFAVRGGFHCAPSCHIKLGTEQVGAVRVSVSYFNTRRELERLRKTLLDFANTGI